MIILTTRERALGSEFADEAVDGTLADWRPALDIYETTEEFYLVLCVPGVSAADLDVTVRGRTLTIAGQRVTELPPHVRVLLLESPRGRFLRSLRMPLSSDMAGITTKLSDGQLVIRVPRLARAPLQVPVTHGQR